MTEERTSYYEYKGRTYYIDNDIFTLDEKAYFKHPDTGEWFEAIAYKPMITYVNTNDPEDIQYQIDWCTMYVRGKEDFLSKFKPTVHPNQKEETKDND